MPLFTRSESATGIREDPIDAATNNESIVSAFVVNESLNPRVLGLVV
ncbi:hypothetical protein RRSWK_05259 [Rhodopirellula sp. SWK7]|nr:hypothetical protein RRSWK_05259 [Rhodopirellula sp. SWK7]